MQKLNASSQIMYDEAISQGFHCTLFDDGETILMEKGSLHFYTRGSRTSGQSSVGKTIADYKPLTKKVLQHFHFPTAKSVLISSAEEVSSLSNLQFPIVAKPVNERYGTGVVLGIQSLEEAEAILKNKNFPILFEEQLQGTEYRIICVGYKFIAAAFRKPAHVVGDGVKTVSELIEEKNNHPWRGEGHTNHLSLIKVDEDVITFLRQQHLELSSIPEKNQEFFLRKIANLSTGGEAWDVSDEVCEENKVLFGKIATACDLNVAGIDVMCQNLRTPIAEQANAGVIEVNASPGLRMHHFPIKGKSVNVAKEILKLLGQ